MPSLFEAARIAARAAQSKLTLAQLQRIARELTGFVDRIRSLLVRGNAGARSLEATIRGVQVESELLSSAIQKSIQSGRALSFESILKLWQQFGVQFAQLRGFTGAGAPSISMLGAFENLSTQTWKTVLPQYMNAGAQDVQNIIRQAIAEQVDPEELARRLRRYVVGSEPFEKLFSSVPTQGGEHVKIHLGKIPPHLRNQARQMKFNAERIAVTELHNARMEAEIQHFINDPLIRAVKWSLSPNRGQSWTPPDECDMLAVVNFYGLGPGVYPVRKVPGAPHPFDRCELEPVPFPPGEERQAKENPGLQVDPRNFEFDRFHGLTPTAAQAAKDSAWAAIRVGLAATRGR